MERRYFGMSAALAAATLVAVTACSTSSNQGDPDLPRRNVNQWVMPLDSYIENDRFFPYADQLLIKPCMERADYSWPVPYQDLASTAGPSFSASGQKLFTPALAKLYGYHFAEPTDSTSEDWAEFGRFANAIGPEEQKTFDACLKAAEKVLRPLQLGENTAQAFANEAYESAYADSAVRAKAKRWRKCMLPAGVADLPRSPEGMPPTTSGWGGDMAESSPSPEEIRVASMDANCQKSSGYQLALYNRVWSRQADLLGANLDDLTREKTRVDAAKQRTLRVISEHAPSR